MPYQKPFIHANDGRVAIIETPDGNRHRIPAEHLPPGSSAGQFVDEEAFVRGFNNRENVIRETRFANGLGLQAQPVARPQMAPQDPRPLAAALPPQFRPQRPWPQTPPITPAQPQTAPTAAPTAPTIVIQQPPAPPAPPQQPRAPQAPKQASPVANTMNPRQQSAPWATPKPQQSDQRNNDSRSLFDNAFRGPR